MEARIVEIHRDRLTAGDLLSGSPATLVRRSLHRLAPRASRATCSLRSPGGRFDGHDFMRQAAEKGAVAAIVGEQRIAGRLRAGCAIIAVAEHPQQRSADWPRISADFALPLVAVGGSNGKTTTKDLLAVGAAAEARHALRARPASTTISACR